MEKKILKPSSSYFLSQKYWRLSRNILGKKIWTYLYKLSQKFKFENKLNILKNMNLELLLNLNYPSFEGAQKNNGELKFSYYLKKFNSSKPDGDYRNFLDKLFSSSKLKIKTILEIGISEGAGIKALKEYFSNSYLWGVDIDPATFIENDKQIVKCGKVDQLNLNSLKINAAEFRVKFDLIIDDGWHHPESQLNSLIAYLPYLNNNGIYIIEDIVHKDYFKLFSGVKKILEEKSFNVSYYNFYIPGRAEISDELGYMVIKREK